ncbi:hypothetical protein IQ07DRAFT_589785 [Pyrenochaeta sp. DS3sAY3a]|nr:hypothetical protein IQ07DRAFT_589785 [Pyrenochaeta sp. DS3sAY3a]
MAKAIKNILQTMEDLENAFAVLPAALIDSTHERKRLKQKELEMVPPAPVKRARRLTLPLDTEDSNPPSKPDSSKSKSSKKASQKDPNKETQRTLSQHQSPLMRLPAELRALIYTFVICLNDNAPLGISWYLPPLPSSDTRGSRFPRLGSSSSRPKATPARPAAQYTTRDRDSALPLLQTCRAIYSEAVGLLYSVPTFRFHYDSGQFHGNADAGVFFAFMGSILPQRRAQIRYLVFSVGSGPATWGRRPELVGLDGELSYREALRGVVVRSELPDGYRRKRELKDRVTVTDRWAVDEVVKGLESLRSLEVWGLGKEGC